MHNQHVNYARNDELMEDNRGKYGDERNEQIFALLKAQLIHAPSNVISFLTEKATTQDLNFAKLLLSMIAGERIL